MDLDGKDIRDLFDRVAEHFDGADEGIKKMFAMLVSTTLTYRDRLMHSTGHLLTVGETKEALDAFMYVLKTHEIPSNLNKRVHTLIVLWLKELNEKSSH